MPGAMGETLLMSFDLKGICVSAGSACSSGKVKQSHVLAAMGAGPLAASAIRVSLGWNTQQSDVDAFVAAWTDLYQRQMTKTA